MKQAVETAFAGERVAFGGKKDLAHPVKIHRRVHAIRLFGPVRDVGVAGDDRFSPVRCQVDAVEMNDAAVDAEDRFHVGAHRQVILNGHGAAREAGLAAVADDLRHVHVEIAGDGAPRRAVILERELAIARANVLQRSGETAAAAWPGGEFRKAVAAVRPLLHHHLPIAHFNRVEQHFVVQYGLPRQRDFHPPGAQERPIGMRHSLDDEIVQDEPAVEQTYG